MVVVRQQPGSAKGFVFLLLEDEFGLANVVDIRAEEPEGGRRSYYQDDRRSARDFWSPNLPRTAI